MKLDIQKVNAVSQKLGFEIQNAYEAYWFLHSHPAFIYLYRDELTILEASSFKNTKQYRVIRDKGGNYWREWHKLKCHAIEENLEIHYTMVDETRTINNDISKNTNIECWLEFGPVEWGYNHDLEIEDHQRCSKLNYHDVDLDSGGPTFDIALIELANLALKKYGPIDNPTDQP